MPGQLFSHYFLTEGIRTTQEWSVVTQPLESFKKKANWAYQNFKTYHQPNEAATEQDFIRPMLEALGWHDYLPQQGTQRNEDIPDHLLFLDVEAKARAAGRPGPDERYQDALVIEESKRFGLSLDNRDTNDKVQASTPHGQLLRYLSTSEILTDGRIRWGILTNGGLWRLYDYRARPRITGYFEADLEKILESGDESDLRLFYLLFRRDSFTPQQGATTSFLEEALAEGRRYEEKVAQDLSATVFESVFPNLVRALSDTTGRELSEVREAALALLYRLLFILYAEDRGLLPVNNSTYQEYGMRRRVRDNVAHRMEGDGNFSAVASIYYDHLLSLFRLIDEGDSAIGLPPYNGGLFSATAAPLLEQCRLSDAAVAPIVYALSHTENGEGRRFVNYRDMSVQQLGSIYERLLEREPVRNAEGEIDIRLNSYARKDSGSYFTPQELVDLIVDQTLKPLAEERLRAFEDKSKELKSDHRPKDVRKAELSALDPAEAILKLKVLDPAMGSGHFLVTVVDFLSDYIAELVEYLPAVSDWLNGEYESPLLQRVENIRNDILTRASESRWIVDESMLTDQAIIRRMVLKRCIYGVDKNPLTVELAKVSLWLHSFTVGAPLSFLDHHLRWGDSLVGLRVSDAGPALNRLGGLFASSAIAGAEAAATGMQQIEEISDADIAEVQQSADLFRGVQSSTRDLRSCLNALLGMRWLTAGMSARDRTEFEEPIVAALREEPEKAFSILANGLTDRDGESTGSDEPPDTGFSDLWNSAGEAAGREGFVHWEADFPGVWQHWQQERPIGGFDAVIGNPPWDRIKLQEVEWFATRSPNLARATTASARREGIRQLREDDPSLAREFDLAKEQADKVSLEVRSSGHYPLLAGGDINLYSLFVERALGLVKPDGIVGLLTPSGIYGDRTAARFFRSISTTGRLAGIFDFENRRPAANLPSYFPAVDSRFKFCALIFGGTDRRFGETECAYFLHGTEAINDPERCFPLAPEDFARVNPNTGTAPIFRTRRDAEITRRIYEAHPILVDRSQGEERRAWPVRYQRMLDMTNDSHLFRTSAQLDAEGFYPVANNQWRRGEEMYLPLFEGKMVQAFDHRAAGVVVNPQNLNRPAQPLETGVEDHANPGWLPNHQYWVGSDSINWNDGPEWTLGVKHVSSSTNARTVISTLAPKAGFGNSLPVFFPTQPPDDAPAVANEVLCLLVANLNSLALDFVARQKLQGQNLNLFILEQLPVISEEDYDRQFGAKTARELVIDHVLRLSYTANDMVPFARDLGYDGPPFIWNEEERRHLRARLDALYFHLYGLAREEADYVMGTFPIVRRDDVEQYGMYRTRDLVLAYMNALAAGDTDTTIDL